MTTQLEMPLDQDAETSGLAAQCSKCKAVWAGRDAIGTHDLRGCKCFWCRGQLVPWTGEAPADAVSIAGKDTPYSNWYPFLDRKNWPTHMNRERLRELEFEHYGFYP